MGWEQNTYLRQEDFSMSAVVAMNEETIDWERTQTEYDKGHQLGVFYKCQCECGNIKTYRLNSIKFGHIKSCGCSIVSDSSFCA